VEIVVNGEYSLEVVFTGPDGALSEVDVAIALESDRRVERTGPGGRLTLASALGEARVWSRAPSSPLKT
jgi:hypothetical protein